MDSMRRAATWLSVIGGLALVAAAVVLVTTSMGIVVSTASDSMGREVTSEYRTPSVMADSPRLAWMWIAMAAGFALLAVMLVRFGGYAGPVGVLVVTSLAVMVAIMSVGIYLAPAAALLNLSAVLALVERSQRDRAGSSAASGPPPGVLPGVPPGVPPGPLPGPPAGVLSDGSPGPPSGVLPGSSSGLPPGVLPSVVESEALEDPVDVAVNPGKPGL